MADPPSEDTRRSLPPTIYEEFKDWNNSSVEEHKILFFVITVIGFVIGVFSKFKCIKMNILLLKLFVVIVLFYGASFMAMLRHTSYSRPDFSAFMHNISLFFGTLAFVPEALVVSMPLGWAILTLWGIILVCYLILKLVHFVAYCDEKRDSVMGGVGGGGSIRNNEGDIALLIQNLNNGDESQADAGDQSKLDQQNHNSLGEHPTSMGDDFSDGSSYA